LLQIWDRGGEERERRIEWEKKACGEREFP
jgi:hypothetical protein